MTRLTLCASFLIATCAAYAAGLQPNEPASIDVQRAVSSIDAVWIPPSFDIETTPEIKIVATPASSTTAPSLRDDGTWYADRSAEGTPPDATH